MRVYFDNAATTAIRQEVIDVMVPFMQQHFGNPSSTHGHGRSVKAALEEARKTIANLIGASIGEVFFTSGGTESSNMALKCSVRDLGIQRIISSPLEHHCVSHCLDHLAKKGVQIDLVEVDEKGRIEIDSLNDLLEDKSLKTMVSLMHANNEIGTMIDLDEVSMICEEHGVLFHSDTVQTVGHFPIDVSKTKIGFITAGAHKFHGPKGVGFIYINNENMLAPYIDGGSQERNMRAGTENVYGIIGMAKALELAYSNLEADAAYIRSLRDYMRQRLLQEFDGVTFNGDIDGNNLYTVLNSSFPHTEKSDMMLMALDIHGVSASGGSACSSGAETRSHVLQAINADPERKAIRFSFAKMNTKEEVDFVIEKLKTIIPAEATA